MSTVLIADDNQSIREFCRCELEDEGYQTLIARNGVEAIALTNNFLPDVIVLDVCMPNVNGLEALARIRDLHPHMAVILFTAFDEACLRDERAMTATACVDKSHDLSELKQVISSILKSNRDGTPYRIGLPPCALATG